MLHHGVKLPVGLALMVFAVPYYSLLGSSFNYLRFRIYYDEINITALRDQTIKYESNGMIDPTGNMFDDRVYIFHGLNDTIILQGHA